MSASTIVPSTGKADRGWQQIEEELAWRGWRIQARQVWAVAAQRDGETEEVLATTRQEAYVRLLELLRLYEAPQTP